MSADLSPLHAVQALGAALAVGLVVGVERGWSNRDLREGRRVAGLRTFALIALCGALTRLIGRGEPLLPAFGLLAVVGLFAATFPMAARFTRSVSITTGVAAVATFLLGVLAADGHAAAAVGAAVVVALLLDLKPELHGVLRLIQPAELSAVLQLGVLSAVVLPLLPDAGYGPYQALNPFRLWLAVLLLASLSLTGHIAMRLRGPQKGLIWVGLLGGLASSTAATVALARYARTDPHVKDAAAAATLAACGVMYVRMAVLVAVLQQSGAWRMAGFLGALGIVGLLASAREWRQTRHDAPASTGAPGRVFDLPTALGFGVLIAIVGLAAQAAKDTLGVRGLHAVALASGFVDVDAILVSSLQMHAQGQITAEVAATAVLVGAAANMAAKAAMAWTLGGRGLGLAVLRGYALIAGAGLAAAALQFL